MDCPYWMLFGHAFFYDQMEPFYHPSKSGPLWGHIQPADTQPWELATLGYLLVCSSSAPAHCVVAGFEDKIRTRALFTVSHRRDTLSLRTDYATAVTM